MARRPSNRPLRPQSPYLAWPPFFARPPFQVNAMINGLEITHRDSPAILAEGCRDQLRLLLEWSVQRVPHYASSDVYRATVAMLRRAPGALPEAWAELPILTKAQLRAQGGQFNADDVPPGHGPIGEIGTSGSTGIAVKVGTTRLTRAIWDANTVREHLWQRRNFSKRLGAIRYLDPERRRPGGEDIASWGSPVADLYPTGPGSSIHIGYAVGELAAWLRRFDPHYLLTSPSVVASLLDELGDARPPALQEIRTMSEPLDRDLEDRLARQWGVRCTDIYSANEVGYIAFRCAEQGRLHVQAESLHVELLDDSGRACAPGESGRVVITPLHNLRTPLLRYEIGDYATAGEPCACGRTLPVLERVLGRVRNLVRTPDGRRYWPVNLARVQWVPAVRQAQYVQTTLDRIEVRVVADRPLTDRERLQVVEYARSALGYPFNIDVKAIDEIERGPTGKFEEFRSLVAEPPPSDSPDARSPGPIPAD
jgi:phenylacetate-CoA ligase